MDKPSAQSAIWSTYSCADTKTVHIVLRVLLSDYFEKDGHIIQNAYAPEILSRSAHFTPDVSIPGL